MTTLAELGEFGLIARFSRQFLEDLPGDITGIGDDCAVIPVDKQKSMLFTTDMLIQDRHFILERIHARDLGYKSLAVNLSDIAAMGGKPHSAYLSIGIPAGLEIEWIDGFFEGIRELAENTGIYFLGGDTTKSPDKLVINIAVIGFIDPERIKEREAARPGDILCVTDTVGDSGGGLRVLLENKTLDPDASRLVKRHHRPRAHLEEGMWLSERESVHAMIDLSDGIESDIQRIMESSAVGAEIEINDIPVSGTLVKVCGKYGWNARETGLSGGEDYCLMITVSPDAYEDLAGEYMHDFGKPLYKIGKITGKKGKPVFTRNGTLVDMEKHGFDHFKSK